MDEYSSVVASRRLWAKSLQHKQKRGPSQRKDQPVTLPVLGRRPSGPQRNSSLHSLLASQVDNNDRESYSRSQLRAMASSKLLVSSNNNLPSSNPRLHTSAERLAPLDPEKTRSQQRRPLPGPIQAAINEVLAVRNTDALSSEREDCHSQPSNNNDEVPETSVPVKRSSPCKRQSQGRRPEWSRYIRRIMLTKGIRGSTLARYRRLVGNVARKNLASSVAGAVERVVIYRREFRSAVTIQQMARHFLHRRRRAKELQRRRAAAKIQLSWRRKIAIQQQRRRVEVTRRSTIKKLTRVAASRVIQRNYRTFQYTCRLREEQLQHQQQVSMLQRARAKLLQRYQSWRQNSTTKRLNQESEAAISAVVYDDHEGLATEDFASHCDGLSSNSVQEHPEVVASIEFDCADASCATPEVLQNELGAAADIHVSAPITPLPSKNAGCLDDDKSRSLDDVVYQQELDQPTQKFEEFFVRTSCDENQEDSDDALARSPIQDNQENTSPRTEINDLKPETLTADCEFMDEPEEHTSAVDNNDDVPDMDSSAKLSTPDPQPLLMDLERVDEVDTSAAVAEALAAANKTIGRRRIARYLLPKLQARKVIRTCAAIQIQCLIRSFLAKLCLIRVRLAALNSLRAQLLASWYKEDSEAHFSTSDKVPEEKIYEPENDDEEDDFGLEVQGNQPRLLTTSDNYLHLFPTRNGQIPPGVPLPQSSAGAPLLALWKWSWPEERWLSSGQ